MRSRGTATSCESEPAVDLFEPVWNDSSLWTRRGFAGTYSEIVRELIQEHGIEGCGGASGGVRALLSDAENRQLEMMGVPATARVVDTGTVLLGAVRLGRESSVKFVLQQ